ncbi:MAG: hypothetical protein AB9869_07165 [Verrucomicrobiia bacterium]
MRHDKQSCIGSSKLGWVIIAGCLITPLFAQAGARFESAALFNNDPEHYFFPPRPARVFVAARAAEEGKTLLVYRYGGESDPSDYFKSFATNYVVLVDSQGQVTWTNRMLPLVFDLVRAEDGGAYVLGNTTYLTSSSITRRALVPPSYFSNLKIQTEGSGSAYIAKVSPSGQLESVRFLGNSEFLSGTSLNRDAVGNLYVAGYYIPGDAGPPRIGSVTLPETLRDTPSVFLAKLDHAGEISWVRVGQGTAPHGVYSVFFPVLRVKTSETGFAILTVQDPTYSNQIGYTFDGVTLDPSGGAAVFDPDGKPLTTLALSDIRGAIGNDGSLAVVGRPATRELSVQKRDPSGNVLWSRTGHLSSGRAGFSSFSPVNIDSAGNVIVAGTVGTAWVTECPCEPGLLSFETTDLRTIALQDLFVLKYSPAGELLWVLQTEGHDQRLSADIWPWDGPFRASETRGGPVIHDDGAIGLAGVLTGTVQMGEAILEGGDFSLREDGSGLLVARIEDSASPAPSILVQRDGRNISLQWPAAEARFVLESAETLSGNLWTSAPELPNSTGDFQVSTINPDGAMRFFRLRQQP